MTERRCPECWQKRPLRDFQSRKDPKRLVNWCIACRDHYRDPERAPRSWRGGEHDRPELRVRFVERSANRKTGPIPVTFSTPCTCPTSCPWYGNGCYTEHDVSGYHWRTTLDRGLDWDGFCERVAALPRFKLWRHNVAGDLPGVNRKIDERLLNQLIDAASHTHGFTYTHKVTTRAQLAIIRRANQRTGLVINLSADNLKNADALVDANAGPVTVVLPADAPERSRTPLGRLVLVCSAQEHGASCASCRRCASPDDSVIIGFRAHGCAAKSVSARV